VVWSSCCRSDIVELPADVSGMSLDCYAQNNLFIPLGMSSTSYSRDHSDIGDRLADGYELPRKGSISAAEDLEIIPKGAGSVYSTVDDMGCLIRFVLSGGAPILKHESFSLLCRVHFALYVPLETEFEAIFLTNLVLHFQITETPWCRIGLRRRPRLSI
jgi:CubicO group peptidase (beta-lactamase class C family)